MPPLADYVVPFTQGADGYRGCDAKAAVGRIRQVLTPGRNRRGVPVQWRKRQTVKALLPSSTRIRRRFLTVLHSPAMPCHANARSHPSRFRHIGASNIIYSVEIIMFTGGVTTRRKYITHLMQSLKAIVLDPDAQGLVPQLNGYLCPHCHLVVRYCRFTVGRL